MKRDGPLCDDDGSQAAIHNDGNDVFVETGDGADAHRPVSEINECFVPSKSAKRIGGDGNRGHAAHKRGPVALEVGQRSNRP